jgi:hypothetical protein
MKGFFACLVCLGMLSSCKDDPETACYQCNRYLFTHNKNTNGTFGPDDLVETFYRCGLSDDDISRLYKANTFQIPLGDDIVAGEIRCSRK